MNAKNLISKVFISCIPIVLAACTTVTPNVTKNQSSQQALLMGDWACETITGDRKGEYYYLIQSKWHITEDKMYEDANLEIGVRFDKEQEAGLATIHVVDVDSYKWLSEKSIVWKPLKYDFKLTHSSSNVHGDFIKDVIYPNTVNTFTKDINAQTETAKRILKLDEHSLVVQNGSQNEKHCKRIH